MKFFATQLIHVREEQQKSIEMSSQKEKLTVENISLKQKTKIFDAKLQANTDLLEARKQTIENQEEELNKLQNQIKMQIQNFQQLVKKNQEYETIHKEIQQLKQNNIVLTEMIQEHKHELSQHKNTNLQLTHENTELKNNLKSFKEWIQKFKDIDVNSLQHFENSNK